MLVKIYMNLNECSPETVDINMHPDMQEPYKWK
jgi:hypothetical protein